MTFYCSKFGKPISGHTASNLFQARLRLHVKLVSTGIPGTPVPTLYSNLTRLSRTCHSGQAPPLAYTPCQRFKASGASYADGSLRLLCAPESRRSGFHTADGLSEPQCKRCLMNWPIETYLCKGEKAPLAHLYYWLSNSYANQYLKS